MYAWLARGTAFAGLAILALSGGLAAVLLARQAYAGAAFTLFFAGIGLVVFRGAARLARDARHPKRAHWEQLLPPRAEPVAAPLGDLVLGLRWLKWGLVMGALSALLVLFAELAWLSSQAGKVVSAALAAAFALVLLFQWFMVGRVAVAARRLGGVLRMGPHGFQHCLLPAIGWRHVQGVDVREFTVRRGKVLRLALAIDPAFAPALVLPLWQRAPGGVAPTLDAEGRLSVPLDFVPGEPLQVAGMAQALADRHGAPRLAHWRAWETPAQARVRQEMDQRFEQAKSEVLQLAARAGRQAARGTASPQERAELEAQLLRAERAMDAALRKPSP